MEVKEKLKNGIVNIELIISSWKQIKGELNEVSEKLLTLPDELEYDAMIPVSKMAFMPGKLVHTNEVLALIGNNIYAKYTAANASKVAIRRIEYVDKVIKEYELKLKELNEAMEIFKIDSEEVFEIREEYVEASKPRTVQKTKNKQTEREKNQDLEMIRKIAEEEEIKEAAVKDGPSAEIIESRNLKVESKANEESKLKKKVSFDEGTVFKEEKTKSVIILKDKVVENEERDNENSEDVDFSMLCRQIQQEYTTKAHLRKSIKEANQNALKEEETLNDQEFYREENIEIQSKENGIDLSPCLNKYMKYFKVDVHTHILPKEWPDLCKKYGYEGWITIEHYEKNKARMVQDGKIFRDIECNCWNVEARIEDCCRSQVDVQVISTVPGLGFNYWAKPNDTLDVAKFLNNHIAEVVSENPKRFIGLGTVPMQSPELAIQELIRCKQELNLPGIQIGTHVNDIPLDHEMFDSFWKTCEDLQVAVFIHPWDMVSTGRMKKYWFPWLIGMPSETTVAICSMIFGGIFDRFPNIKVCFAHGGGSFAATIGRIEHGFKVRPDLCQLNTNQLPSSYFGKFYVDSLVHDPEALKLLISKVGYDFILMGSDYPFPLGEEIPGNLISTSSLQEFSENQKEMKQKMLGLNALKFLGYDIAFFE